MRRRFGTRFKVRGQDRTLDLLANAPATHTVTAPHVVPVPRDRGSRRGAKRCIVTDALELIDHHTAKAAGLKGAFFQSRKEAKHYIYLEMARRAGRVRPIAPNDKWRQVDFPLFAVSPDGLKVRVCVLRLDFAYELWAAGAWERRYEDVKPTGGHREDTYLLKRKWFEAQYGITIAEV